MTDLPADKSDALPEFFEDEVLEEELRIARLVFVSAVGESALEPNETFKNLMDRLDSEAIRRRASAGREASNASLSKMHGDWFEWLLCLISERVQSAESTKLVAVRLPNVSRFDSIKLYEPALQAMLSTLRNEVRKTGVELISSNPDFVLVKRELLSVGREVSPLAVAAVDWHENRYLELEGKCSYEDIRGYLAAKYTLRPDRRLQIPHEGSLMKALYVHLQTRLWITDPLGLDFHAVSSKVGPADRKALRTVATHSITSVGSKPQAAVDKVYQVKTIGEAEDMFRTILNA